MDDIGQIMDIIVCGCSARDYDEHLALVKSGRVKPHVFRLDKVSGHLRAARAPEPRT